jgi:hypothetical protein
MGGVQPFLIINTLYIVPPQMCCYIEPFKVPPRTPQITEGANMNHLLGKVPCKSMGFLESPLILRV